MHKKIKQGLSPHPEILQIEQKFSIPTACFVFALIGLALGLTVARDSKLAGFVVGIAVIFAYYIVMFLAEAYVKGYYAGPQPPGTEVPDGALRAMGPERDSRSVRCRRPRLAGAFSERQLPISLPFALPRLPVRWSSGAAVRHAARPGRNPNVVVVLRVPALRLPGPGLLDRYVSRLYLRVVALSFLALLGLFYISTFIDASDKLFKGVATGTMVMQLLIFKTPQFVYFVIPIAALLSVLVTFGTLSRTSELTVMKACGVSLYRIAVPVVLLSLAWSAALFALDQELLARANRRAGVIDDTIRGRPPKTFSPLNRQWVIGRDGSIYHYGFFDPRNDRLSLLTVYRLIPGEWKLASETFATTAVHRRTWMGLRGWSQEFPRSGSGPPHWRKFEQQELMLEPPDYFATEMADTEMMTALQLRRSITELSQSGFNYLPQAVELQRKIAFPFVTFVMTLLAVPFGVTTGRRGALYGIGLGIVIALSVLAGHERIHRHRQNRAAPRLPRRLDAEHHRLGLRALPHPYDEDIAPQLSAVSSQLPAFSCQLSALPESRAPSSEFRVPSPQSPTQVRAPNPESRPERLAHYRTRRTVY